MTSKLKLLFSLFAILFAIPALAADPIVSGVTGDHGAPAADYTTVSFVPAANGYTVTFENLVVVFNHNPPEKYLAVAVRKADSHGHGTVWLLPAAANSDLVNGATFQLLGLGKEWKKVAVSSPILGGRAAVNLPYMPDNGWQISTAKVVFPDGTTAWASKGWPHKAYEAYDACGNPLNVWGAGRDNLGASAPPSVKAYIKANLPCPPGQMARK